MKAQEIREKFIQFFEKNGHQIIQSSSLIPQNDSTHEEVVGDCGVMLGDQGDDLIG